MNKKYKILIVEDQPITAMDIKQTITNLGYEVIGIAKSYESAIQKFEEKMPDLVIMDICLEGDIDGIDTVKQLYKIKKIPVIYLTAFTDDETIDRAVQTNPSSYEIKPFNRASLNSSIKIAISKLNDVKYEETNPNRVDLGHKYYFDMITKELFYEDDYIKISAQESALLVILIKSRGSIVTNKQIEYEIWGNNVISESSVRTLVWRLRTKLEYKVIETIPYQGVKLQ